VDVKLQTNFDELAILAALLVVWSFAIWAVVLLLKWIVVDLAAKPEFWTRLQKGVPMVIGILTGLFYFNLAVRMSLGPLDSADIALFRGIGMFLGIGAGAVSAQIHDTLLYRLDNWIRK